MRRTFFTVLILSVFVPAWSATAQEKHSDDFVAVAPFIDDQTLAVARVELAKLDLTAFQKQVIEPQLHTDPERAGVAAEFDKLRLVADQLRGSGGKVYFVVSLAPLPGVQNAGAMGISMPTAFAVVPGAKGPALDAIDQLLKLQMQDRSPRSAPPVFVARQELHGATVVGPQAVLNQLKTATAVARPEFEQALAVGGDRPVCVAVVPPAIFARATAEMLRDPAPGGDRPLGPILSRGVRWIGAGIDPNLEKFSAMALIQSADADSAGVLAETIKQETSALVVQLVAKSSNPAAAALGSVQMILSLLPEAKGDQLVLSLEGQRAASFGKFAQAAWTQSMAASWRMQSQNNLKQLGLAMLNYEDKNKQLPDRAIRDKDGKPLLSWRVATLPEIEEGPLYKEFHLDEPWDSEHNRKLIDRMPEGLKSPDTWHLHPGKTRYLVPVGENLAFPPDRGLHLHDFTDGTSRTIMIVEAAPESAVIWTKPDDIEIEQQNPLRGLANGDQPINAAFGDCHVEGLDPNIKPATIWALFTRNGGEKIDR